MAQHMGALSGYTRDSIDSPKRDSVVTSRNFRSRGQTYVLAAAAETGAYPTLNEWLDIDCFTVRWQSFQNSINMHGQTSGIGEGLPLEEWFDQKSAEFPLMPVNGVDPFVCKWSSRLVIAPHWTDGEVLPVDGRHTLHILWLDGVDELGTNEVHQEGLWQILMDFVEPDEEVVIAQ